MEADEVVFPSAFRSRVWSSNGAEAEEEIAMATLTAGNFGRRPCWRTKHRVLPAAAARVGGERPWPEGVALCLEQKRSEWGWVGGGGSVCVVVVGRGIVSLVGLHSPLEKKGASSDGLGSPSCRAPSRASDRDPQLPFLWSQQGPLALPQSKPSSAWGFLSRGICL